jgi:hypothetical protein
MKLLTCACCGGNAVGKQWFNRDKGYGLCRSCSHNPKITKDANELESCYGIRGVHFDIPIDKIPEIWRDSDPDTV